MPSFTPSVPVTGYYELLGLEPAPLQSELSTQDIKHAYKRTLLRYHPDKAAAASLQVKSSASGPTVDEITLAYKTLSDPRLRTEYDRHLLQSSSNQNNKLVASTQQVGLEIVDLDSLAFDETSEIWSRDCRCGNPKGFVVTEPELEKYAQDGELIVGCKGCSLWLKVLFGVEDA